MNSTTLGFAVLCCYVAMATLGWLIAFAALGSPRYFPVLSLMGMGAGVPAVALFMIRLARLLGYATSPNDISQQTVLLCAFIFAVFCWGKAFILTLHEPTINRHVARLLRAKKDAR